MKYLKHFDELAKKVPGTPSGLQNDYSGVLCLVNGQGRRAQAELCLAREVAAPESGKGSILPPDIQTYKTGFFYLAGELLYGNYPRENLALYTEEGLDFLLYEILWNLGGVSAHANPADYPEERHKVRNLASDFKKFIALVTEEEKIALLAGAQNNKEFAGEPYTRLFEALRLYNAKVADFAGERKDACFFSPLEAYKELLAALGSGTKLKVSPEEFNKTRVIAVEDAQDMEPLFRTLAKKLKESGYRLIETRSQDLRPEIKGGLDLKGFITALDEAEYVGWKIKKLLSEKAAAEGEVSVVCFSRETAALLPLVFTRYGLQASTAAAAVSSHFFQVYAAAVRVALNLEPAAEDYIELLSSRVSAFCLEKSRLNAEVPGTDRKTLRQLILEAGYKASVNREHPDPRYWIEQVLKRPGLDKFLSTEEKRRLADMSNLAVLAHDNIFSDILAVSINMAECADYGLVKTIGRLAARADRALKACGGTKHEPALPAVSLLNLMAETEYYPRGEESRDTYLVPIVAPEKMANTSAAYIFVCGLTGEADKLKKMPIPERLALELGLGVKDAAGMTQTYPESLRDKVYRKFEELARLGKDEKLQVMLSYGYNNIGGDMAGMSNLVRAVKKFYKLTDNKGGKIPSLYAAQELMFTEAGAKAPDVAYAVTSAPPPASTAMPVPSVPANRPPDLPAKAGELDLLTLLRLRELKYRERENNKPPLGKDGLPLKVKVGVRDFAEFINCPRKFISKIFMQAAGIQEEKDHESQIPLTKGSFWHSVFEEAGKAADFYSGDTEKIFRALWSAFEALLKTTDNDPETFQDMPLEEFKDESRRVFRVFAENEASRQVSIPGLKGAGQEIICEMELETIPLGPEPEAEKLQVLISGRIDRADIAGEGASAMMYLWDYKAGRSKPELAWTGKKSLFGQKSETALQLAIYAMMVAKEPEKYGFHKGFELGRISGANIFLDGTTNMKDLAGNADSLGEMAKGVRDQVRGIFKDFFETKKLNAIDEDYSPAAQNPGGNKPQPYNPRCWQYCNTHMCRLISLGGLKRGDNA